MTVEPLKTECVVADRLDLFEFELRSRAVDEGDRARVALASGARAIPAKHVMRVDADVTISPTNVRYGRAARRLHFDTTNARIRHDSVG